MVQRVRGLLVLLAFTLLVPLAASAQTSSSEQMARNLFEAGRTAYEAGRFDQALRYFQESYDLSQRPALLFNIASAADRLQDNQRALDAYRQYLQAVPTADNRELAESRIAFLEGVLARQGGAQPTAEVGTPAQAAATVAPTSSGGGDQPARGGDVTGEWWFWTLIAVLVVGAAVGITAGVVVGTSGIDQPPMGTVPVVMALGEW